MGVTNFCRTNLVQARKDVTNGLVLYPNNPWLTNLWELLNRKDQQQQQQNKDQDKDKDKSTEPVKDEVLLRGIEALKSRDIFIKQKE